MDWLDLLANPKDSQESSPTPPFKNISSSVLSFLYGPALTSIYDYWNNHRFDYTDLCWQSNVSAFEYGLNSLLCTELSRVLQQSLGHQIKHNNVMGLVMSYLS